tara:strand:- start:4622 stop:5176 length:555 start_codon:yes stop_codon:yes gene_type:complete
MLDVLCLSQHWPAEVRRVHQQLRREVEQERGSNEDAERRRETAFQRLMQRQEDVTRRRENQRRQEKAKERPQQQEAKEETKRRTEEAEQPRQVIDWRGKVADKAQAVLESQVSNCGHIGAKIEGSELVRDFCCACGEPMRVTVVRTGAVCLDCKPTGRPGKKLGRSVEAVEIDYHGSQFNQGEW